MMIIPKKERICIHLFLADLSVAQKIHEEVSSLALIRKQKQGFIVALFHSSNSDFADVAHLAHLGHE